MRWYWWTALGLGGLYMLSKKSVTPAVAAAIQPITTAGGAVQPITTSVPDTGIAAVSVASSASMDMLIQAVQNKYGLSVSNVAMIQNSDGTLTFTGQQKAPDGQSYVTVVLGTFRTADDVAAWART